MKYLTRISYPDTGPLRSRKSNQIVFGLLLLIKMATLTALLRRYTRIHSIARISQLILVRTAFAHGRRPSRHPRKFPWGILRSNFLGFFCPTSRHQDTTAMGILREAFPVYDSVRRSPANLETCRISCLCDPFSNPCLWEIRHAARTWYPNWITITLHLINRRGGMSNHSHETVGDKFRLAIKGQGDWPLCLTVQIGSRIAAKISLKIFLFHHQRTWVLISTWVYPSSLANALAHVGCYK